MSNNNLSDLYGIQYLKNLKNLVLRENHINKLDSIDGLPFLSFIDLSNNVLRNVERCNIGNLPNLKIFVCGENYLKNVNAFSKLNSLIFISFENNKIADYSHVEKLNDIENLRELNISNNPITKAMSYRSNIIKRFFKLIKIDGIEVTKEERELIMLEMNGTVEEQPIQVISMTQSNIKGSVKLKYVNLDFVKNTNPKQKKINDELSPPSPKRGSFNMNMYSKYLLIQIIYL
jgi:hypothetical protein